MNTRIFFQGMQNLLVRRYMGPFWIRRQWLKKTQWLSKSELEEIQLKLLKKLINHCYNTVPYYRQLMDERAIKTQDINTLEDIQKFPILTKQDVLNAGDSLISTKYPRWMIRKATTGGTTGTPLIIYRDIFSIGNEHAFVRRQWDWAGINFSDRCAYLTGRLIVRPDQRKGKLYAYDPVMKELILSTYHLSPETAKEFISAMKEYEVKAVVGYPSAVYLLARTCLDVGAELYLHTALTSSETLTESMRKTITEAFNCKVYDFYGSAERVCYIFTCENGSYHVIPEYGLTELIPIDESDDNYCKVISTGFWNLAMPLIRYDLGDIIIPSVEICLCDRHFPTIKSIIGRKGDVVRTPSGREYGAAILTHLLYGVANILESQIVQDTKEHITIKYIPSAQFCEKDLNDFKVLIAKHLPTELAVDLVEVDSIDKTDNGKLRPVISMIDG